jgi:hypothetical protein
MVRILCRDLPQHRFGVSHSPRQDQLGRPHLKIQYYSIQSASDNSLIIERCPRKWYLPILKRRPLNRGRDRHRKN